MLDKDPVAPLTPPDPGKPGEKGQKLLHKCQFYWHQCTTEYNNFERIWTCQIEIVTTIITVIDSRYYAILLRKKRITKRKMLSLQRGIRKREILAVCLEIETFHAFVSRCWRVTFYLFTSGTMWGLTFSSHSVWDQVRQFKWDRAGPWICSDADRKSTCLVIQSLGPHPAADQKPAATSRGREWGWTHSSATTSTLQGRKLLLPPLWTPPGTLRFVDPVGRKDDLTDEGSWRGATLPRRQDMWQRRQLSRRLPIGPHWRQESESGALTESEPDGNWVTR